MSRRCIIILVALVVAVSGVAPAQDSDASANSRRVVHRVAPVYPDLARRMSITGAVKIIATVAPNGSVRSSEPVGGNPVLIQGRPRGGHELEIRGRGRGDERAHRASFLGPLALRAPQLHIAPRVASYAMSRIGASAARTSHFPEAMYF